MNIQSSTGVLILVFSLLSYSITMAQSLYEHVELKAKSHFSFSDDYGILEDEAMYYKVNLNNLEKQHLNLINKAAISGESINLKLPKKSISFAWPKFASEKLKVIASKNTEKYFIIEENGNLKVSGKLNYSFEDSFFLLQVGNQIIQIDKKRLDGKQIEMLSKKNIGETAEIKINDKAIVYNWQIDTPTREPFKQVRRIASEEEIGPDEITNVENILHIRGKVLYSASEPTVVIQSHDFIFYVKRSGIMTESPEKLNLIGAKVSISVPAQQIEFIWQLEKN